ncbi:MAG: hypothetical protein GY729_04075 [Desulfobacteraceae bacterium]|nr:hypothetical protein [Desulfobacteraceae bacterium]
MPLSFQSDSHGQIAFGFFNIEADMLLLEHYFFFANDFCRLVCELARDPDSISRTIQIKGFHIKDRDKIGDLMGAIHGIRFKGFIGEIYKKFAFPGDQRDFKQNPLGYQTRSVVKSIIKPFSVQCDIGLTIQKSGDASICEYIFKRPVFFELIHYVLEGGYPRWKDGILPGYAAEMKECLEKCTISYFRDFDLSDIIE